MLVGLLHFQSSSEIVYICKYWHILVIYYTGANAINVLAL